MKKIFFVFIFAIIFVLSSCTPTQVKKKYNVTFDSDGGTLIENLIVEQGEKVIKPEDPIKENYEFLYWEYNDLEYDFDKVVTKDIVLVAKWKLIDEHIHNFISEIILPTCTSQGFTIHACDCGYEFIDSYVAAVEHDIVIDEKIEPTCTKDGLTQGEHCINCDYVINQQIIEMIEHIEVIDEEIPATKESSGKTRGSHCYVCNKILVEQLITNYVELTVNTHNYGSASIDKDIYVEGEEITLIATPNENCGFYGWLIDGQFYSNSLITHYTMKQHSLSIEAVFTVEEGVYQWNGEVGNGFSGGTGTKEDPYLISSGAELKYLYYEVNADDSSYYYKLTNSIDLNNVLWEPIGQKYSFKGHFDGNNHYIYNLNIQSSNTNYYGLFGRVVGTVENLNIRNAEINVIYDGTEEVYVGGVCAKLIMPINRDLELEDTISNCSFNGVIKVVSTQNTYVGGIFGYCYEYSGKISSCISNANIDLSTSGSFAFVGLIGGYCGESGYLSEVFTASGDILVTSENTRLRVGGCFGDGLIYDEVSINYSGNIDVSTNSSVYVGGGFGILSGRNTIQSSEIDGNISVNSSGAVNAGGLIGYYSSYLGKLIEIYNCNSYMNIDCSAKSFNYESADCGGIIGTILDGEPYIFQSQYEGNINVINFYKCHVGGITGYGCLIEESRSTGIINCETQVAYVGGISGITSSQILNCYSSMNLIANSVTFEDTYISCGGILGRGNHVTNCYFDGNINADSLEDLSLGGIMGSSESIHTKNIENCLFVGEIELVILGNENNKKVGYIIGYSQYTTDIINCYYKTSFASPNNLSGNSITNYISDSISFWKEKLKFDELIWNFNNVDFYNNVHPTLIWISNN